MQICGLDHPGSDLRRRLVALVLEGVKTATAGLPSTGAAISPASSSRTKIGCGRSMSQGGRPSR